MWNGAHVTQQSVYQVLSNIHRLPQARLTVTLSCHYQRLPYNGTRMEWKNILSAVHAISRKLETTVYATHFFDLSLPNKS